jgi:hypothetical protein
MLSRGRVLPAAFACLLLGSCGDAPTPTKGSSETAKPARPNTPADTVPPQMVAAVPAGKGAVPINLHFQLGDTPTLGKALPVDIAIVPTQHFDSVSAHFQIQGGGLSVATGEDFAQRKDVSPGKILRHQMVLLPVRDGVYMITAGVETQDAEGTFTRVFYIPVIVPAAPSDATG